MAWIRTIHPLDRQNQWFVATDIVTLEGPFSRAEMRDWAKGDRFPPYLR